MDEDLQPAAGRTWRWLAWLAFVAGWTASLLSPQPVSLAQEVLPEEALLPSFKTAHVVCYAVMTVLSGWLRVGPPARRLLLVFLSGHAFLTELLQHFVPGRTPSLADVAFDHVGILIGLIVTHRWWWGPNRKAGPPGRAMPERPEDTAPAAATARAPASALPGREPD